jgi:PEP-CTERM motif-containing protein
MRRIFLSVCCSVFLLSSARAASADVILIDRQPDGSDQATKLDGFTGAGGEFFTIGGSFVFTGATGTFLRTVGVYMQRYGNGVTPFSFQVFGDAGGMINPAALPLPSGMPAAFPPQTDQLTNVPGPDFDPNLPLSLSLISAPLDRPVSLVSGDRYWITATTLPFSGPGSYLLGLTSNPLGTFAASDDLTGSAFSYVGGYDLDIYAAADDAVPEPATFGLVATGLLTVAIRRRRALPPQ